MPTSLLALSRRCRQLCADRGSAAGRSRAQPPCSAGQSRPRPGRPPCRAAQLRPGRRSLVERPVSLRGAPVGGLDRLEDGVAVGVEGVEGDQAVDAELGEGLDPLGGEPTTRSDGDLERRRSPTGARPPTPPAGGPRGSGPCRRGRGRTRTTRGPGPRPGGRRAGSGRRSPAAPAAASGGGGRRSRRSRRTGRGRRDAPRTKGG